MSFDPGSMFASLFLGSIGLSLLYYARAYRRLPHGIIGVVLLVYPYFIASAGVMVAIGVGLLVLLYAATKLGL